MKKCPACLLYTAIQPRAYSTVRKLTGREKEKYVGEQASSNDWPLHLVISNIVEHMGMQSGLGWTSTVRKAVDP